MNVIDKIRAEIERRIKESNNDIDIGAIESLTINKALRSLLSFLDTLEEPVSEDFDAEIKRFFDEYIVVYELPIYGKVKECVIEASDYEMIAYHFYQFGLNSKPK